LNKTQIRRVIRGLPFTLDDLVGTDPIVQNIWLNHTTPQMCAVRAIECIAKGNYYQAIRFLIVAILKESK
jgi:hypothetical protein